MVSVFCDQPISFNCSYNILSSTNVAGYYLLVISISYKSFYDYKILWDIKILITAVKSNFFLDERCESYLWKLF